MVFDRGSVEHRLALSARVRLRVALAARAEHRRAVNPLIVRSVLGQLLRHADMRGICWPSTARMAENLEIGRASVVRAVAVLVELGIVTRQQGARSEKEAKKGKSTRYRLAWERLDQLADMRSTICEAPPREPPKRIPGRRASASPGATNVSVEHSPPPPKQPSTQAPAKGQPNRDAVGPSLTAPAREGLVSFADAMRELSGTSELAARLARGERAL